MTNVLKLEVPIGKAKRGRPRGAEELSQLFAAVMVWCRKTGIPPEVAVFSFSNAYLMHGCMEYREEFTSEESSPYFANLLDSLATRMDCVIRAGEILSEDDDDVLHLLTCAPLRFISGRYDGFRNTKEVGGMMKSLAAEIDKIEQG